MAFLYRFQFNEFEEIEGEIKQLNPNDWHNCHKGKVYFVCKTPRNTKGKKVKILCGAEEGVPFKYFVWFKDQNRQGAIKAFIDREKQLIQEMEMEIEAKSNLIKRLKEVE